MKYRGDKMKTHNGDEISDKEYIKNKKRNIPDKTRRTHINFCVRKIANLTERGFAHIWFDLYTKTGYESYIGAQNALEQIYLNHGTGALIELDERITSWLNNLM